MEIKTRQISNTNTVIYMVWQPQIPTSRSMILQWITPPKAPRCFLLLELLLEEKKSLINFQGLQWDFAIEGRRDYNELNVINIFFFKIIHPCPLKKVFNVFDRWLLFYRVDIE